MNPERKDIKFIPGAENIGKRLDKFLCDMFPDKTRNNIQKLIEDGFVKNSKKALSKNYRIRENDEIFAEIPPLVSPDILPESIELDIEYEDSDLIIVNKPRGMVVHPASGNYSGTLVNALIKHCGESLSGINGVARPGIVHRIDKNTSGLLIVAKNDFAHISLAEQIKAHSFLRSYRAVVHNNFKDSTGSVEAPIGRSEKDRKKMCVTEKNSKYALTHFEVIKEYYGFSYLSLTLETGRTHQIRVHMAHIGHPVAGDDVYGPHKGGVNLGGQCLHAKSIGFVHPRTGESLYFESELPDYFVKYLTKLENIYNK